MPPLTDEFWIVRQGVRTPRHLTPFGVFLLRLGAFAIAAGVVAWNIWGGR